MIVLLSSNYIGTLFKSTDNEITEGWLERARAKAPDAFYTKTPEQYEEDLRGGWISPEEWIYLDDSNGFVGYIKVESIHQINPTPEELDKLEGQFGETVDID